MRYLIIFVALIALASCQPAGNTASKENIQPTTADGDNSSMRLKKSEKCVPVGSNPWAVLVSRYEMGMPDNYLVFFTAKELRLIRNSIYAEKGYRFQSNDLATYFGSQKWYCPRYGNVDSLISPLEHDFINYIQQLEKMAKDHYDKQEIHNYFVNLFKTKPKVGRNSIPLYFQREFLHDEGGYMYYARNLVNDTEKYTAFVYNVWGGDDSDGIFYLAVLNNATGEVDRHEIEHYQVVSKDTIRTFLCKIDYNPKGNFYDEDVNLNYSLDTIGTKDYILSPEGNVEVVEKFR